MTSLLLLHGAIGAADQLEPLIHHLSPSYEVHAINFFGHGQGLDGKQQFETPASTDSATQQTFSIAAFAEQAASFIKNSNMSEVNIFGYSMGGYVAMYMARHLNINIKKIITLGTKFHWDEAVAEKECKMLRPDTIEQKIPAFAQALSKRHGESQWRTVLNKTAEMLQQMGKLNPLQADEYAKIQTPSLIMLGDRDKMVGRDETIATFQSLPNAQLAILPGTPHPIEQTDASMLAWHIKRFIG
jgi:pimeloyl-ACP methyl ester carboxylesterase